MEIASAETPDFCIRVKLVGLTMFSLPIQLFEIGPQIPQNKNFRNTALNFRAKAKLNELS